MRHAASASFTRASMATTSSGRTSAAVLASRLRSALPSIALKAFWASLTSALATSRAAASSFDRSQPSMAAITSPARASNAA